MMPCLRPYISYRKLFLLLQVSRPIEVELHSHTMSSLLHQIFHVESRMQPKIGYDGKRSNDMKWPFWFTLTRVLTRFFILSS